MKKWMFAAILICILGMLTACGGSSQSTPAKAAEEDLIEMPDVTNETLKAQARSVIIGTPRRPMRR